MTVTGGKLTTYRRMAQDAVDAVARLEGTRRPSSTHRILLSGAEGVEEAARELENAGLDPDQREHLLATYGSCAADVLRLAREDPALGVRLVPGLPHLLAEVAYACRAEYAVTLADCLYLRTRIAVLDGEAADRAAPTVAQQMARELGWGPEQLARQLQEYRDLRAQDEAWRATSPELARTP